MASIISIRNLSTAANKELWTWLTENIKYDEFLIDSVSLTFINDDDAVACCLKFGWSPATYNPELLNRKR